MGWGEYARSKTPLKLVFITMAAVAVNLVIIWAFQVMLTYRYAGPIDEAMLASMDSQFANCTIVDIEQESGEDSDPPWYNTHRAVLVNTADGSQKFLLLEKALGVDRWRCLDKATADVPIVPGEQYLSSGDIITVGAHYDIVDNADITHFSSSTSTSGNNKTAFFILLPMLIVEYLAYCFLFKREELL